MTDGEVNADLKALVDQEVERRLRPLTVVMTLILLYYGVKVFSYMVFDVPKLKQMYDEMDIGELPTATKLLFTISKVFVNGWFIAIPLFLGLVIWLQLKQKRVAQAVFIFLLMVATSFQVEAAMMPWFKIIDKLSGHP